MAAPARVAPFLAAAFALSWIGALPMVAASFDRRWARLAPLQLLMLFGPALAAIWAARREGGWPEVRRLLGGVLRWRVGWRWWAGALLGPGLVTAVGLGASALLGLASPRWPAPGPAASALLAIFVTYLFLNTEELAWRGFLWPRLRDRLGPLPATWLLAAIWAVFHLPLFLVRGGHPGGHPAWLFLAMVAVMTFFMSWAYEATGGSVLVCHLLHQASNAWGEVLPAFPAATGSVAPMALTVLAAAGALVALRVPSRLASGGALPRAAAPARER